MASCELLVPCNQTTVSLVYFAEVYRIDLVTALLLYEKYESDVMFFFFMLAGSALKVPRPLQFQKILMCSEKLLPYIVGERAVPEEGLSDTEMRVYRRASELYQVGQGEFRVDTGIEDIQDIRRRD